MRQVIYDGGDVSFSIVPFAVEQMGSLPAAVEGELCLDYKGEQYRGSGENWVNIRTLEEVELVGFLVRPSQVRNAR